MVQLYRTIWQLTGRMQLVLIGLSIMVAALAALQLQYQKDIINRLAGDFDQYDLLFLGAQFFCVLLLSSGLKAVLEFRSASLGETFIRKIRIKVIDEAIDKKPESTAGNSKRGALATIISAEAEQFGGFAGSAIATPVMQIGILVSVIAFIALTQPHLGIFVIIVVLLQAMVVLGVQRRVNVRVGERVEALRRATNQIGTDDLQQAQQSVLSDFDEIFEARREIFFLKQSSKFAMNTLNGIGTVGILMLGGWFIIQDRTDIGTVVADLAGFTRIAQPWRELISFYRILGGARVRYELLQSALAK